MNIFNWLKPDSLRPACQVSRSGFSWRSGLLLAILIGVGSPRGNAAMMPLNVSGFNRDIIIESSASGPPYGAAAVEFNPGEGNVFYQSGLAGKSRGLPVSGNFTSALDNETTFQFQPYTGNNALVLSGATGLTSGTLSLVNPAFFSRVAVLANSAGGGGTPNVIFNFSDGSSFTTNYSAVDWFFNSGFALQGTERINVNNGGTSGAPDNPRFYQTTIDLAAALGPANKTLSSVTFEKASGAGATAIYAISGEAPALSPAVIQSSPTNTTVDELGEVSFAATATGNPVPTVQWQKNNVPIPGATNSNYLIPSAMLADHGAAFRLVASNVVNNISHVATSSVATLTVLADTNKPLLLSAESLGLNQSAGALLGTDQPGHRHQRRQLFAHGPERPRRFVFRCIFRLDEQCAADDRIACGRRGIHAHGEQSLRPILRRQRDRAQFHRDVPGERLFRSDDWKSESAGHANGGVQRSEPFEWRRYWRDGG